MPELPEVETIRKGLSKLILGKIIARVEILKPRLVKYDTNGFVNKLTGKSVADIQRKGKVIFMRLSSGDFLIARLGMTGQLVFGKGNIKEKHARVIIGFKDTSRLVFNDTREFGYLHLADPQEKKRIEEKIGIDALDPKFNYEYLKYILRNRNGMIKAFFLDQKKISGIGNIYADEICFDAKIRPNRKIQSLNDTEIKKLYNSIIRILKLSVEKKGTTFSDYVDASGNKGEFQHYLKIYKKEGKPCSRCGGFIKKTRLAGRSTRYCESCQK